MECKWNADTTHPRMARATIADGRIEVLAVRHRRRAGGLMSWAASKAVDQRSRRRALRAHFLTSKAPVAIRGLLLADVLAYLLQLKSYLGHRIAASPEMLSRESFSPFRPGGRSQSHSSPSETQSMRRLGVLGRDRDIHVHMCTWSAIRCPSRI